MQIRIQMDDYKEYIWDLTSDMEYDFVGRFFVIKAWEKWVGMYATDRILTVKVR